MKHLSETEFPLSAEVLYETKERSDAAWAAERVKELEETQGDEIFYRETKRGFLKKPLWQVVRITDHEEPLRALVDEKVLYRTRKDAEAKLAAQRLGEQDDQASVEIRPGRFPWSERVVVDRRLSVTITAAPHLTEATLAQAHIKTPALAEIEDQSPLAAQSHLAPQHFEEDDDSPTYNLDTVRPAAPSFDEEGGHE